MRPRMIQVHDTFIRAIPDYRERICPNPPVVRKSTSPIENRDRAEIAAGQQRQLRKHGINVADSVKDFEIAPVRHRADTHAVDAIGPVDTDRDRSVSYRPLRLVMNSHSHTAHRAEHCRRLTVLIEEFNTSYPNGAVTCVFGIGVRPWDATVLLDGVRGIAFESSRIRSHGSSPR